jgi:arylformamidase
MKGPDRDVIDISIPLRFDGPQPNAFGAARATATPLGDTRTGSGVNYAQYTLTPHCNGTHTECIGHITDERFSVRDCLREVLMSAYLTSVTAEPVSNGDMVITADALRAANINEGAGSEALVVRTLPNHEGKRSRCYGPDDLPAYFSDDAIELIVAYGITHMLTDLPSIDRLADDGKLLNHRLFWNMPREGHTVYADSRIYSTITELVYIPTEVPDGPYTLNLQIAPFETDAAPSRPLLISAV